MPVKIVFLGPESTGKTSISAAIAERSNATFVPEFARTYLHDHGTNYTLNDVIKIAETQARIEQEAEATGKDVICDTDLITIKIWLEYYSWEVPEWLEFFIAKHRADKYLLLYPDIPWVADEQRKNQHDRMLLFNRFEQQLNAINANYSIIKGGGNARFEECLNEIKNHQ